MRTHIFGSLLNSLKSSGQTCTSLKREIGIQYTFPLQVAGNYLDLKAHMET